MCELGIVQFSSGCAVSFPSAPGNHVNIPMKIQLHDSPPLIAYVLGRTRIKGFEEAESRNERTPVDTVGNSGCARYQLKACWKQSLQFVNSS